MVWLITIDEKALKELKKLDKPNAIRILDFIKNKLAAASDPRTLGAALRGSTLGNFWKYHIGDYRVIASIGDETVTITVLKVGNRKDVYK